MQPDVEDYGFEPNESRPFQCHGQDPRRYRIPLGWETGQCQRRDGSNRIDDCMLQHPSHPKSPKQTQFYRPSTDISSTSPASKPDGRANPHNPLGLQHRPCSRPFNFSYPYRDSSYRSRAEFDDEFENTFETPHVAIRTKVQITRMIRDRGDGFLGCLGFGNRNQTSKMLDRYMDHLPRPSNQDRKMKAARMNQQYVKRKVRRQREENHRWVRLQEDTFSGDDEVPGGITLSANFFGGRGGNGNGHTLDNLPPSSTNRGSHIRFNRSEHISKGRRHHKNPPDSLRERKIESGHRNTEPHIEHSDIEDEDCCENRKSPICYNERTRRPRTIPVSTFTPDNPTQTCPKTTQASMSRPRDRSSSGSHLSSSHPQVM